MTEAERCESRQSSRAAFGNPATVVTRKVRPSEIEAPLSAHDIAIDLVPFVATRHPTQFHVQRLGMTSDQAPRHRSCYQWLHGRIPSRFTNAG